MLLLTGWIEGFNQGSAGDCPVGSQRRAIILARITELKLFFNRGGPTLIKTLYIAM
jgi:hypothetical protein